MPHTRTLTITSLGRKGDGVAETDDGPVHIPYTIPGDVIQIEGSGGKAKLTSIEQSGPGRVTPVCRHFGACGGCLLQHLDQATYLEFKHALVTTALGSRGLSLPVTPVTTIQPQSRRRTVLSAIKVGKRLVLGYHERKGRTVVDIKECPVLSPSITAVFPLIRQLCEMALPKKGTLRITILETMSGLDVAISGMGRNADRIYPKLAQQIVGSSIIRLTVDDETVIQITEPFLDMNGVKAMPVSGGFTQATAETENLLAFHVTDACQASKNVADLFAGIGTFSLRLAKTCHVHAVESDRSALKALSAASRMQAHLKPISLEARDLFHRPLLPTELNAFDAIIFDPPRAGAQSQVEQIAQSKVPLVVAISCNPATFARDIRILFDAGYETEAIHPVDQFLFSPHIEVVAVLRRTK
ncbi:MAG: class I SAM-dependent RNA methyltransferase [Stappiaceae bacterium]